jgi:hypothetical protein
LKGVSLYVLTKELNWKQMDFGAHKTAVISATSSFILHQNVDYSNQNWQN